MSYIRINISDKNQTISGEVHGATGEALVAALSAEPETIEELALALARFEKPKSESSPFEWFSKRENLEPYDAGILVIDLAGRVIACESSYSFPSKEGAVFYRDGECRTDIPVRYRLPDDWLILGSTTEYKDVAKKRREERAKQEPLDARMVLYGKPLLEFIAREIAENKDSDEEDLLTEIHAGWLMTEREDLRGKTPREAMLERHDFVGWDLQFREEQWSLTGVCPPTLPADSRAYKFAGFGTHEMVVYYDLARYLSGECRENGKDSLSKEIERLEELKDKWLEAPQYDLMNRSPAGVTRCERKRQPLVMSAQEALIDEDCPICVGLSEDFETPMFWHLDGSSMDDRFEFSFCETRDEWEEEQRRFEEFNSGRAEGRRREDDAFDFADDDDLLDAEIVQ